MRGWLALAVGLAATTTASAALCGGAAPAVLLFRLDAEPPQAPVAAALFRGLEDALRTALGVDIEISSASCGDDACRRRLVARRGLTAAVAGSVVAERGQCVLRLRRVARTGPVQDGFRRFDCTQATAEVAADAVRAMLSGKPRATTASEPRIDDPLAAASLVYAGVLERRVRGGVVDYSGLAVGDTAALDAYLTAVAQASLPDDRRARIGLLIDAYNALVLQSVLRHGRPSSVRDAPDFFTAVRHTVAGRRVSLDTLEKKWLAPLARDPRTHFVLVCAAQGCPILESQPFYGDQNLDRRLERATRRYVASPVGARIDGGRLGLSKIFEWYAEDFGGGDGVVRFVVDRLPDEDRVRLTAKPDVYFFAYDWALNGR